jgi:HK97 family phage portal protein
MAWWDKVVGAVTRSRDVVVAPHLVDDNRSSKAVLTDPSWMSAPGFGSPRDINFAELEAYENDVTVQAAINYIIDSIATTEWNIVDDPQNEGEKRDPTSANAFFQRGVGDKGLGAVLRGVVADILGYDCGVIVLTFPEYCYDENKCLMKLGIPPLSMRARDGRSFIKQVNAHGDVIKYWQYSFLHAANAPIEFIEEEIIYIQERPSTRSPYGTSKLEIIKNIVDYMMAVQSGHRAEQENALQLGGIISHANVTDVDKLKRLSQLYNANNKGEHNKGRWLVTGGNVDATPVSATAGDDTWITGAEFYQQQILSIFKVPKTVLGITDSSVNRATSVSQKSNFKRYGVATMMTLIENIFTNEIVKPYFDEKLRFRFVREVDLEDEAIRADVDAKNVATGVRTPNELRVRDGLDEIEAPEPAAVEAKTQDAGEIGGVSDDDETPEEGVAKAIDLRAHEDAAVEELMDLSKEDERSVLAELEALYGEIA